MNEATHTGHENKISHIGNTPNAVKTAQLIMTEAQTALDESNKRGKAYNTWYANTQKQIQNQGCLVCWKDGLILTMQVCEASLDTQVLVQASFRECSDLLTCNRAAKATLLAAGSSTDTIDQSIAEAETTACRLADALSKESLRFERFSDTWDQIAATIADWYGLHPSVLWQLPTYMPPGMFDEASDGDDYPDEFGTE